MAKKKQVIEVSPMTPGAEGKPPRPTVNALLKALDEKGGVVEHWHDIKEATHLKTLQDALKQGKVTLGIDGSLRLNTEVIDHGPES